MRTFLTTLAVMTVVATPAFAQSFCTCDGTGNVLKFANNPVTYQNQARALPAIGQSGLHAFAMLPGPRTPFNLQDPAIAGGGSRGYNEMLRNY